MHRVHRALGVLCFMACKAYTTSLYFALLHTVEPHQFNLFRVFHSCHTGHRLYSYMNLCLDCGSTIIILLSRETTFRYQVQIPATMTGELYYGHDMIEFYAIPYKQSNLVLKNLLANLQSKSNGIQETACMSWALSKNQRPKQ